MNIIYPNPETVQQLVENGIDYLNNNHPDWLSKIQIESLDIKTCKNCVLGQVFGGFSKRPVSMSYYCFSESGTATIKLSPKIRRFEEKCGFDNPAIIIPNCGWVELQVEWERQLKQLKYPLGEWKKLSKELMIELIKLVTLWVKLTLQSLKIIH